MPLNVIVVEVTLHAYLIIAIISFVVVIFFMVGGITDFYL